VDCAHYVLEYFVGHYLLFLVSPKFQILIWLDIRILPGVISVCNRHFLSFIAEARFVWNGLLNSYLVLDVCAVFACTTRLLVSRLLIIPTRVGRIFHIRHFDTGVGELLVKR
jgi:hypothetical protein